MKTPKNNFLLLQDVFGALDFYPKNLVLKGANYMSLNHKVTRASLLNAMVTKPQIREESQLDALTTYYTKPLNLNKLHKLLNNNYFEVISLHTIEELMNAATVLYSVREPTAGAYLPSIVLVFIPQYYKINKSEQLVLNLLSNK